MDRLVRDLVKVAEEEGLKVLGVTRGGKHRFVVVVNDLGWKMSRTISSGSKISAINMKNARSDFKRFAHGQDYGLRHVEK